MNKDSCSAGGEASRLAATRVYAQLLDCEGAAVPSQPSLLGSWGDSRNHHPRARPLGPTTHQRVHPQKVILPPDGS